MLPLPHTPLPSRIADPWGESEESEWGRTASESAQVSAYVHICLHNLPLSACFLVTLLLLSPQEALKAKNAIILIRGSVLPSAPSYVPFRRFVLLNYPAAQSAPKSGACETAMTQERISFQLAVCCDKMARITSICVAMIMIPQELMLYDAQDTGVLHQVFSVLNVLQVLVMSLVMLPSASPSGSSLFLPSFCWQVFVFFVITCRDHYPVFVAAGKDSDGFPHVSPTGFSS